MQKMSKGRKLALSVVSILMIICIVIAVSYAVWTRKFTQTGTNVATYNCLDITYEETTKEISMIDSYPMMDSVGLAQTPYTIKMSNKCDYFVDYQVNLNELSSNTLEAQYVKIALNDNVFLLNSKTSATPTLSDSDAAWILQTGIIGPNATKNFEIKMWMDENTSTTQGLNKEFKFRITIEAIVGQTNNTLANMILKNNELKTETPDFAYSAPNTNLESNVSGVFTASDDLGTSYYFRGNITNNYVLFGGFYWRILRINGDGTIRLVYDGTSAHANGESSTDRRIGTSRFNNYDSDTYDRKYVGYTYDNTYDDNGYVISGADSEIKTYIDDWYTTNIENTNLDSYIAEEIYCNDTTTYSETDAGYLYYGAYGRNYKASGNNPQLTCETDSNKTYGGKYLLKVGLISADELAMAGFGYNGSSTYYAGATNNYLYIGNTFWTGSPSVSSTSHASVFYGYFDGSISSGSTRSTCGVRPVINLTSEILVTSGDGSATFPYLVSTN